MAVPVLWLQALKSPKAALLGIVVGYVLLGVTYSFANPAFESPDEVRHFAVVRWIADGHGLPVPGQPSSYRMEQEAAQPPLYYLLGAALTAWIHAGPPERFYELNPHAAVGVPGTPINRNLVVHAPGERRSWEGRLLALRVLRWSGVLLGVGTVLSAYALARTLAPGSWAVPLTAAAFVAFHPMYLFISSSATNDALIAPLGGAATYLSVRIMRGRDDTRHLALLGLALGAALLTKLSGLIFMPLALLALVLRARTTRQRAWLLLGLPFGLAGIVAGWWYMRNYLLTGDPLGLAPFINVVGQRETGLVQLWAERWSLLYSFWGLFGAFTVLMPLPVYWALLALSGVALAGAGLGIGKARSGPRSVAALLALAVVLNLAAVLLWTSRTMGSQGRLLFPSLAALAALVAWGLAQWVPARAHRWVLGAVSGLFLALAAAVPFAVILPAYAGPERLKDEAQLPDNSYVRVGDYAELRGIEVTPKDLRPGDAVEVTLYWRALRPSEESYSLSVKVIAASGETVAQLDTYPFGGNYATRWWRSGELLRERYRLPVSFSGDQPQRGDVVVGWYDPETLEPVTAYDGEGRATYPRLERVRLAPTGWRPLPLPTTGHDFGGVLRLSEAQSGPARVVAGGRLRVETRWHALAPPPRDYSIFLHLVPESGPATALSQYDGLLGGEAYPTGLWPRGETRTESVELVVPPNAPPGRYRLLVGVYDWTTGQRLPVERDGDAVVLGEIEVLAP